MKEHPLRLSDAPSRRTKSQSSLFALLVLALASSTPLRAENPDPIPQAWPSARYEKMKQQSPFALATPVAPVPDAQASFAANWFVSGIGRLDGEDFVTIKSRDLSTQFSLYGHDTNAENGLTLASIDWSEKIGKSTVIIKKGTETAKLEFNEAEIRGPAQVTTAKGTQVAGAQGATPAAKPGARPGATPFQTLPGLALIPQPGNPRATPPANRFPQPGQPPATGAPQQGQNRSRLRIINTPQHP